MFLKIRPEQCDRCGRAGNSRSSTQATLTATETIVSVATATVSAAEMIVLADTTGAKMIVFGALRKICVFANGCFWGSEKGIKNTFFFSISFLKIFKKNWKCFGTAFSEQKHFFKVF